MWVIGANHIINYEMETNAAANYLTILTILLKMSNESHCFDCCSSSCFPCVGVRLVYWSLRSTATFVICFHRSLLLAFSLHFSSSSAFLRSLFTQTPFLAVAFPVFWNLLASLSRLFSVVYPLSFGPCLY